jgi:predicted NUDIX family phosphoesterase
LNAAAFTYQPRSTCETDPAFKQLIPYVVLTCGDLVFHYRRGASGTEARLRAKRSVGIGGHINDSDAGSADPFRAGMLRELTEEVAVGSPSAEHFLGFLFDPSTPVGEVHLGVVYRYELDAPDVTAKEAGIAEGGFATVADLLAVAAEFETWSQLVLPGL